MLTLNFIFFVVPYLVDQKQPCIVINIWTKENQELFCYIQNYF